MRIQNSRKGELMEYIKGPDFPTSAIIYGSKGIRDAYETGRGKVYVRARATVEDNKKRITKNFSW